MPCGTPSIGAQRWTRHSCLCLPIAEADSILGFFLYKGQCTCRCTGFMNAVGYAWSGRRGRLLEKVRPELDAGPEKVGLIWLRGGCSPQEDGSPGSQWTGGASDIRCKEHPPVPPHQGREKEAWEWDVMCPRLASQPVYARVGSRPLVPQGLLRPQERCSTCRGGRRYSELLGHPS